MGKLLGEKLKKRREDLGLDQEQVALACEMTRTNFSPYENGKKNPSSEKVPLLAKALKISILTLYEWMELIPEGYSVTEDFKNLMDSEDASIQLKERILESLLADEDLRRLVKKAIGKKQ